MASDFTAEQLSGQLTAHILLADDEPRLLNMLAHLLREAGYQVTEAQGGKEACDLVLKQAFDLALLDLRMPEIDGFDTMAHIARVQPDCGVVVVSGESSFSAVSRALRHGALDYLRKPYDPDELLTTVARVLKKRSLLRAHEQIQQRLEKSEALHRYIVNNSPDIVFMLDADGRFCFINRKVEGLLGYDPSELCGEHFRHLIDDRDFAWDKYSLADPHISADNPKTLELRLKARGGRRATRHFEVTAFPIDPQSWPHADDAQTNLSSKSARYYGTARDVTERKEAAEFINYQAYHDLLTRLPNRTLFQDRLDLAITHARRDGTRLAVMFLDLDRFKVINDTLGHGMGDRLLQAVAHRLEQCLRKGDTLSRFGGDEFTLLLPSIHDEEDVRGIARKLIDAMRAPFQLGDHEVFVGISIGISIYPDVGSSIAQLIQSADIAMYHVKASGKDGYRFYKADMSIDATSRLQMERDLRLALKRNELKVFYQPQVCSKSNQIVGFEALVRWQHPKRGLLYPGEFLPLAEETRLISQLSERVLDQAFQDAGRWIRGGHPDLRLAVNLSPVQVEHPRFVETLLEKVKTHDFPTRNLEIEITENAIMSDLDQISEKLRELAATGIRIAIDDFGTGYSSLNYLHKLPIHTLKVDQSFVKAIRSGEDGACIVNAIVAMAHGLKLEIIAEGVETGEQLSYLRRLGCHQVQGFYYGPARPPAKITRSLGDTRTRAEAI
ncbi:EAL domain-containing protein [Marinobacter salinisoli]|uniref:EAL domain-containing protein n=1 Tax=Marinobacter salinisoli TaxID=2769486 RepID=A0ABX7MVM2_9GAMM|nr:EAL domain-containing protein [Marinobacter salinisoli]QSP96328.1 EAL domain-containing protein [Marinobacter salinisoli]